jgi:hypothetical protein
MEKVIASLPIALYVGGLALGLLKVELPFASAELNPLAQWMLVLPLALQSLWAAFSHLFATERVAQSIGWPASPPFQHEIGSANLGIGVGAIAASILGAEAAWAIFFVAACFQWGAAFVHMRDMVRKKNFAINNAGPIFWWDILTPLTLLIALV